jgi:hypothetical protein
VKGFGSNRRKAAGARPSKAARPASTQRSPDAALGRETRNLLGPSRRGTEPLRAAGRRPASGASSDRGFRRGGGSGIRSRIGGLTSRIGLPRTGGLRRLVSPARAGALLGMLASGFLYTLVTGPTAFGMSRTDIPQLAWTDAATVTAALGLDADTNVFRIDTAPLAAALERLPAVADASVSVSLPDAAVVVAIQEREPILAWQVGNTRYLADREGKLFAMVSSGAALPAGVAVIDDRRDGAADRVAVGATLDTVDLDVATRLGSLSPHDIGSAAPRLRIAATDADGFVVSTQDGWLAVFGFYSPATRQTAMIPGQVRLLRSLLAGREATVSRIILASETDGTYIPKRTPKPSR